METLRKEREQERSRVRSREERSFLRGPGRLRVASAL